MNTVHPNIQKVMFQAKTMYVFEKTISLRKTYYKKLFFTTYFPDGKISKILLIILLTQLMMC